MSVDDIKQSDVDLTEQELNKIFFSPGDIKNNPIGVKKVEKKKIKTIEAKPVEKTEPINNTPQVTVDKKPQGRPKKWTKEKIDELKLLRKKESEERKKKKDELLDVARLSLDTPLSSYERTKILTKQLEHKKNVEEELIKQKNDNRESLKQKHNLFLRNKPKCENHCYIASYFDSDGGVVAACSICSKQINMTISDWTRYIQKTRRL